MAQGVEWVIQQLEESWWFNPRSSRVFHLDLIGPIMENNLVAQGALEQGPEPLRVCVHVYSKECKELNFQQGKLINTSNYFE